MLHDLITFATGKQYKTEDGLKFPAEAYAYVPDPSKPSTWKIRLWETPTTKETAAQVGRAAAAFSAGGFRGNQAQIPSGDLSTAKRKVRGAWTRQNPGKKASEMPESIRMSVAFAVDDPETGLVRRWGKLFEPGEYPDKQFTLSPEEMAAAVAAFEPVPLKSGHPRNPSPLDGKLGWLEEVEVGDDSALYGMVAYPKLVDEALAGAECTVSTEWHPETKQLAGLSLVTNPRVPDAVLMAAVEESTHSAPAPLPEAPKTFSELRAAAENHDVPKLVARLALETDPAEMLALVEFAARHDTREGQRIMQDVHDTVARGGAVCKAPTTNMASQHEADAAQSIHDMSVDHGATCSDASKVSSWYFSGPTIAQEPAETPGEESSEMTIEERLAKFFAGIIGGEAAPAGTQPTTMAAGATPAATPAAVATEPATPAPADTEKLLLQQEVNRLRAKNIEVEATSFADDVIRQGRALPVEKAALIQSYTQAAVDDLRLPGTVQFSDGKEGSRVEILKAQVAARKPNMLDGDRLPNELTQLINMAQTPAPATNEGTDEASITALINKTPAGQAALAAKNGRAN